MELVDESLNIFSLRQLAFETSFESISINRLLVTVGNISTRALGDNLVGHLETTFLEYCLLKSRLSVSSRESS